jgi:hypothetical protein
LFRYEKKRGFWLFSLVYLYNVVKCDLISTLFYRNAANNELDEIWYAKDQNYNLCNFPESLFILFIIINLLKAVSIWLFHKLWIQIFVNPFFHITAIVLFVLLMYGFCVLFQNILSLRVFQDVNDSHNSNRSM